MTRLRMLGPPQLVVDGVPGPAGSPRESVVLAVLAEQANRTVPADVLVDALWGDSPPATARDQVYNCVAALRKRLTAAGGWAAVTRHSAGYQLDIAADNLDLTRFAALADEAAGLATAGDLAGAARAYAAARALWRGRAFAGLDSEVLVRAAIRLQDRRLDVVELAVQVELELGRAETVLGELTELVDEHPLRESLHRLLMLALNAVGRRADALAAFQRARTVLVEELGVEPGSALREAQAVVLAGEAEQSTAPQTTTGPVPRQLPAVAANFTGRDAALRTIRARLCGPVDPHTPYAVRMVTVTGAGGVGKSTLAVRAAHELAADFPHGQLYADQRQESLEDSAAWTFRVLGRFLRALGMAEQLLPEDPAERAELYRMRLAGRRVLILLDGVRSEDDVVPLLPGATECAVITTSRARLAGLPAAANVHLDVLGDDIALRLLATFVGPERIAAEPEAAAEVVAACDGLPLALTIAGAKLSSRRHWKLADLVDRLTDETQRIDELSFRGLQLRSAMTMTYRGLDEPARRLFRRLTLTRFPDLPQWSPGALLDSSHGAGDDALAELVEAHLVADSAPADALTRRWRFHDLVRLFAAERAAEEDAVAERAAASKRLLSGWLVLAESTRKPEFGDRLAVRGRTARWTPPRSALRVARDHPLRWVDEERPALVAAVAEADAAGWHELCWELAVAAGALFEIRGYFDDWREVAHLAVAAADRAGDELGGAAARYSLGSLLVHQGRPDDAVRHLEPALAGFRTADLGHGVGAALRQLATVRRLRGDITGARDCAERALPLLRAAGDRSAEAHVRSELARLDLDAGVPGSAQDHVTAALALAREAGAPRTEAQILYRSADVAIAAGRLRDAAAAVDQVLHIASGLGDRVGVGYAQFGQGRVATAEGNRARAVAKLTEAVATTEITGDRNLRARAYRRLADLSDEPDRAAEYARHAEALSAAIHRAADEGR